MGGSSRERHLPIQSIVFITTPECERPSSRADYDVTPFGLPALSIFPVSPSSLSFSPLLIFLPLHYLLLLSLLLHLRLLFAKLRFLFLLHLLRFPLPPPLSSVLASRAYPDEPPPHRPRA
jgi:hypothetical protein